MPPLYPVFYNNLILLKLIVKKLKYTDKSINMWRFQV